MPQQQSALDNASRAGVAIGAILLLVGNLIPTAGAKGVILVFGEIFIIAGAIGMGIAYLIKRNQPVRKSHSNQKSQKGRSRR